MTKIIVTVGISNSGKSTFASTTVQHNPDKYVVINRDKIRELLFSYTEETVSEYYHRPDFNKLEKQVTKYEDVLINEALCEGKIPIVDATHLETKYLERFKFWNVPVEVKWFDVTLKEALTRNMSRQRKVDESIIQKQYSKYLTIRENFNVDFTPVVFENDIEKPHVFLLDLDGTIAHMKGRSPFDWKRVGEDDLDEIIKKVSNSCYHYDKVIVCTGRDAVCLPETEDWLKHHGIGYDAIFARKENDNRADWVVKEEMWRKIAKDYYIAGLIDDRQQVVRRARALGLKVLNVAYNNF